MNRLAKSAALLALSIGALTTSSAGAAPRRPVELPTGLKATDMIEVADGKKIPASQFVDEMNQLQEALESSGDFSIRKKDGKPFRGKQRQAGQEKEAQEAKAAFNTRLAKIRARQANGFKDLVRKRGAGKAPKDTPKFTDGQKLFTDPSESEGTDLQFAAKPAGPLPGPDTAPSDEPLEMNYEENIGSKEKASIFVAFGLENTGDKDKIGCEGGLETGVYLFDNRISLAKGVLKGSVSGTTATGGLELYLIGKMVDGFPKSGSMTLPELKKSISPPEVKLAYSWSVIKVGITAGAAGEFGMSFTNTQTKAAGSSKGQCTVGVIPYVRGSGHATAFVQAAVYKAGVEIKLTFFDMKLPATASIALSQSDVPIKGQLSFKEDLDVTLDSHYLDGDFAFFVQTTIPQKGEPWLKDFDWDTIYRKSLFTFDGFVVKETLAHFSAKQTPFH